MLPLKVEVVGIFILNILPVVNESSDIEATLPVVKPPVPSSNDLNWIEAPVNFHNPVIVSLKALEAGPLVQSSLTKAREEVPSWVTLNDPPSKETEP